MIGQVFIDADKGGYAAYYDLVMDLKLLNPRGPLHDLNLSA
jgi:predicted O-methyltransferase YrrM